MAYVTPWNITSGLNVHNIEFSSSSQKYRAASDRPAATGFAYSTWMFLINLILMWTLLSHNSLSFEPFIFLVVALLLLCIPLRSQYFECTMFHTSLHKVYNRIVERQCSWCGMKRVRFVLQYACAQYFTFENGNVIHGDNSAPFAHVHCTLYTIYAHCCAVNISFVVFSQFVSPLAFSLWLSRSPSRLLSFQYSLSISPAGGFLYYFLWNILKYKISSNLYLFSNMKCDENII